jgi:hypothetical protein
VRSRIISKGLSQGSGSIGRVSRMRGALLSDWANPGADQGMVSGERVDLSEKRQEVSRAADGELKKPFRGALPGMGKLECR